MSSLSDDLEALRKWRENNDRKSREILHKWNTQIAKNLKSLGKEKYIVLEQVCIAALDCFEADVAQRCIKLLYKEFPQSLRVKRLEAMFYETVENYDRSLKILDQIIQADDTNSAAQKRKIAILKGQNKTAEAIKELTEYLKIFMADVEAWQELSELYINEHDFNKAVFCLEELVLHNPHNHLLYQRLGDVKYTLGGSENVEHAKTFYCQAVKLNSKNVRALYGIYLVASSQGVSLKHPPQKRKENTKLASWALEQLNEIYAKAKVSNIEERLSALQI